MSLVGFHKLLIASAVLFCAGFGGWQVIEFLGNGGGTSGLVGAAFLIGAGGLAFYLTRLDRFLGRGGGG